MAEHIGTRMVMFSTHSDMDYRTQNSSMITFPYSNLMYARSPISLIIAQV